MVDAPLLIQEDPQDRSMGSQHHTAAWVRVPARSAASTMEALRGGTPSVDSQASEEASMQVADSMVVADSI